MLSSTVSPWRCDSGCLVDFFSKPDFQSERVKRIVKKDKLSIVDVIILHFGDRMGRALLPHQAVTPFMFNLDLHSY